MTTRRLPLQKLFPNKTVFRLQVWFASWRVAANGPIAPELAALMVAAVAGGARVSPATMARVVALTEELQGIKPAQRSKSDRSIRSRLAKDRAEARIGREF